MIKETKVTRHALGFSGNPLPVIGMWGTGLSADEMKSAGESLAFIDLAAKHSHYNLLTLTMRNRDRQMTDPAVHDWFKNAVEYAGEKGFKTILDLDIRHSIPEFRKRYPNELQQRLWLREISLNGHGNTATDIIYDQHHGDAIYRASNAIDIKMVRVYSYEKSAKGIEPETILDITERCKSQSAVYLHVSDNRLVQRLACTIPGASRNAGRMACIISLVTLDYPDVFSPYYLPFETAIVRQYADLPLAGLMKDKCGLPAVHDGNPEKNGFWFSAHRAAAYAERTGGCDLVRDSMLMYLGERGREAERQAAINRFMDMVRQRMTEIGENFYRDAKNVFGPNAFTGSHETVFPYPDAREFERNGLNWWTAPRDFAQSDEITPYCCRTSMAKKFGSPVWYNQWYAPTADLYAKPLWSYALAGGRMNFHPLHWSDKEILERYVALMRGDLQRGDCRISLLNFISTAPLDCPVAVIFGHAAAMNWAGPAYEDIGMGLSDAFWRAGYYADLIPSSEIKEGVLCIDKKGRVWFGKQRYAAVALCNPEFEGMATAEFFQRAAQGDPILARIGQWTRDFDGKQFDGQAALPQTMTFFADSDTCAKAIIAEIKKRGIEPQTPATVTFPQWHNLGGTSVALPAGGVSRLVDGTVLVIAGEDHVSGDPIRKTLMVNGHAVSFDAIGVAAVRLDQQGELLALAAGGLQAFKSGNITIDLPERIDLALWQRADHQWQGVVQGHDGPIPEQLTKLASNWLRLPVPIAFPD